MGRIPIKTPPLPPGCNDPLHGLTLEAILKQLVYHYGWHELGQQIKIRCFTFDPSLKSSLQFLRRTPWARAKVEELYLEWAQSQSKPGPKLPARE